MPNHRTDKFKVGDKVRLSEDLAPVTIRNERQWLQDGSVYTIAVVENPEYRPPSHHDPYGQSNWSSMGHTQFVQIKEELELTGYSHWSGAYWELVDDQR